VNQEQRTRALRLADVLDSFYQREVLETASFLRELAAEPVRVPIHMERVDKSTSQHWWNEQAGIRMPSPELYTRGDTVLCWVNEGELLAYLSGITGDAK
jgi:hypothetical protein